MTQDGKRSLKEKLALLRADYLSRLPRELAEVQGLGARLRGGERDRPVLGDLHKRLHKITGTAGSFGCGELTDASRVIEQRVKGWLDSDLGQLTEQQRADLQAALADLPATVAHVEGFSPLPSGQFDTSQTLAGREPRIWLIESDAVQVSQLTQALAPFNFSLKVWPDLAAMEQALSTDLPDLVMVSLNGEDSAVQNDAIARLSCPCIVLSAQEDFTARVRASRLGAVAYFLKPLDVPRLANRITQILELARLPAERVLIVDDDADLRNRIQLVLMAAGMEAEVLVNPEDIIDTINRYRPELVLMDLHMPQVTGPDLAGVIRQYDQYLNLPIVYLSAETDFAQQLRAIRRGSDDFLTKPVVDQQLVETLRCRIARARQLDGQIRRDSLTGLLKHAAIKQAASDEVEKARASGKPVTLALLDIDFFKRVNDTYGHSVGDEVITAVSVLLRQRLRQTDLLGRYGGEEFLVVLPECNRTDGYSVLESVRQHFATLGFQAQGQGFTCTLSAGLVCLADFPQLDTAALLELADQALYQAKSGGRNQVCMQGGGAPQGS